VAVVSETVLEVCFQELVGLCSFSDSATILDIDNFNSQVKVKLTSLKETPLLGGWVSQLQEQMQSGVDGHVQIKKFKLLSTVRRRSKHNKFITDHRDISAVKNEVIESLVEYLSQRFAIDKERVSILKPFATLHKDADIKAVHDLLCSDLDLEQLGLEYDELGKVCYIVCASCC